MKNFHGATLCLAILATGGCQSFPMHFGMQERGDVTSADMSSYFAQRMNDGRRHLSAQRTSLAITAFRQASYHPDYSGEAYNGMAISFDRLGRYDLAEQYFAKAIQAAPGDERFARNAARFETTMLARRGDSTSVQMASTQELPAVTTPSEPRPALTDNLPAIAAALDAEVGPVPEERLQRVSAREVRIAGRDEWASRANTGASARPAVMHIQGQTFAQSNTHMDEPQYPVRITLASVSPRQTSVSDRRVAEPPASRFTDIDGAAVRVRVSGDLIPRERASYPITLSLNAPR